MRAHGERARAISLRNTLIMSGADAYDAARKMMILCLENDLLEELAEIIRHTNCTVQFVNQTPESILNNYPPEPALLEKYKAAKPAIQRLAKERFRRLFPDLA
jgi:hypothetical protein